MSGGNTAPPFPVNTAPPFPVNTPRRFRWRLQLTIMGVVTAVTVIVLLFAQHRLEQTTEQSLRREFQGTFEALRDVQDLRRATLMERCRGLAERLHVPSERDLRRRLYAHGTEVLADVIEGREANDTHEGPDTAFHVEFLRFLDAEGEVIEPSPGQHVGALTPAEQRRLRLPGPARNEPQLGYLVRDKSDADGPIYDLIAMPVSLDRGQRIVATLVLGFEPAKHSVAAGGVDTFSGVWVEGRVFLLNLPVNEQEMVAQEVTRALARQSVPTQPLPITIGGVPHLLLMQCLNVSSAYPPAYEVGVYSLAKQRALQWRLRWQVLGAGGFLLLVGLGVSHLAAVRFSRPVEQLVQASAQNRARRQHAEEALALTVEGLRRAVRFSADASHQLKTPVAVLRTGLEELQVKERLTENGEKEVQALIRQTVRLSGLIDDLLLLSRLDAGRLQIQFNEIDLVHLVAAALDDRSVLPDPFNLEIVTELPPSLPIRGEARYVALLLQNLVENAGKYNRPGGCIRLHAHQVDGWVELHIANTTRQPIPLAAQPHIFDRFHRGSMGEDIPGYGLGLNLARELARLHRGTLELLRSDEMWTEFVVRFASIEQR